MYHVDRDYKELKQYFFFLRVYYGTYQTGLLSPCRPRPPYCDDNLTDTINPPMTAAWIDKPCLN